ncbi:LysM peptidoglycan-binding domain-containing protein [Nostoc sp. UIC 10607]|uniref:CIS tube protein n=1 Tax=Nostoc sp. UIC 10607 TaxID=3045935 RepID=UPI0039A0F5DC
MALEKATIRNLQTGEAISVRFNPGEYSLDVSNSFAEIGIPGLRTPPIQYIRGNARTLKMELFFDSFEQEVDVRAQTQRLTTLLNQDRRTQAPPILLFSWGSFNFKCVLESVGQRFTMFLRDGTPARATLTVTFREYEEVNFEIQRGFLIGSPTVKNIVEGNTLSKLAGETIGNPEDWRRLAEANNIENPRKLRAGSSIIIPDSRTQGR